MGAGVVVVGEGVVGGGVGGVGGGVVGWVVREVGVVEAGVVEAGEVVVWVEARMALVWHSRAQVVAGIRAEAAVRWAEDTEEAEEAEAVVRQEEQVDVEVVETEEDAAVGVVTMYHEVEAGKAEETATHPHQRPDTSGTGCSSHTHHCCKTIVLIPSAITAECQTASCMSLVQCSWQYLQSHCLTSTHFAASFTVCTACSRLARPHSHAYYPTRSATHCHAPPPTPPHSRHCLHRTTSRPQQLEPLPPLYSAAAVMAAGVSWLRSGR